MPRAKPPSVVLTPPVQASPNGSKQPSAGPSSRAPSPEQLSNNHLDPSSVHAPSLRSAKSFSSIPSPPVVQTASAAEDTAIDQALAQKHKRRYLFRSLSSVSDKSEEFNLEIVREEIEAEHNACKLAYRHIDLVADGRVVHTESELPVDVPRRAEYVWEVMYENQRGLSLWGKTWYSSNSLLPTDPSPFTLPLVPVGGAIMTRDGEEEATEREGRIFSTVVPKIKRKSINCGYNLETFQTPSPSWVWITPWMVKMRTNTDEQGWRYNLWFHRKGWRSHAAPLNWWGWVRRRAWVRLRGLIPHEEDKSFEKLQEDAQEDDEPLESFDEVFDSGKPLLNIIRHLATFALDREKQGAWDRWLEKSSKGSVEKLKDLLKTPSKLDIISHAFIFIPSRTAFLASLEKQNLITEQQCMDCASTSEIDLEE